MRLERIKGRARGRMGVAWGLGGRIVEPLDADHGVALAEGVEAACPMDGFCGDGVRGLVEPTPHGAPVQDPALLSCRREAGFHYIKQGRAAEALGAGAIPHDGQVVADYPCPSCGGAIGRQHL